MLIDGSTGFKYLKYEYDSLLSNIVDKLTIPNLDKQGLKYDFIKLLTHDNYDTVALPELEKLNITTNDQKNSLRKEIYQLPFIFSPQLQITPEIDPINILFFYDGDVSTINNVAVPSSSDNVNIIGSSNFKYLKYDYDSLLSDIVNGLQIQDLDKEGLKNDFIKLLTHDNYDTVALPELEKLNITTNDQKNSLRKEIYQLPFIFSPQLQITPEIDPINILFFYDGDVSTINNVATPALFRTPTVIYVDLVEEIDSTTELPQDPYYRFFSDAEGTTPYPDQINGVPDLNVKKRYLFKRTIDNKDKHAFFISDQSDRTAPSDQLIIESSKDVNNGILNDESILLTFSPDFSVIDQSLYFFCTVQSHGAMNKQFVLHDTDRLMIRTHQDGKVETLIPYSNKVAGYQLESTAPITFNTQQFISGNINIEQAGEDSAGSLSSDFQQGDKPLRLVSENNILIGVEIESDTNLVGQFHGTTLVDDNEEKPWKRLFTATNGASGFPLKETTKVSNEFGELIDNLAIQNL